MEYHIYRHEPNKRLYGIKIQPNGAPVFNPGDGFGIFVEGKYTGSDLGRIIENLLIMSEEIDRLLEEHFERECQE